MGDEIRPFIEKNMRAIDSKIYNDDDFKAYFNREHINEVCVNDNNKILAFCCIMEIENKQFMCYSWCDGSYQGIKAYSKGMKYIFSKYQKVVHTEQLPKFITKRIH